MTVKVYMALRKMVFSKCSGTMHLVTLKVFSRALASHMYRGWTWWRKHRRRDEGTSQQWWGLDGTKWRFLKSKEPAAVSWNLYQPGSQRGGSAARRQWLPEWYAEEQKLCRRRCRWAVPGSPPGQCSYRLHRGETRLQELILSLTVEPRTPGEGEEKLGLWRNKREHL